MTNSNETIVDINRVDILEQLVAIEIDVIEELDPLSEQVFNMHFKARIQRMCEQFVQEKSSD